jgi:hypothetical protein
MARGQRKTLEEKIGAKQDLIASLQIRVESEKRELSELLDEKRRKELEVVSDMITDAGLEPAQVAEMLQQYMDNRIANAS